jgi:hypothetical protein
MSSQSIPNAPLPALDERTRLIRELAAGAAVSHFAPLRGRYEATPVVAVPEALLVYRVENGRLIAELDEHVRREGLDLAELRARQESLEVQQLLHRFLAEKAAAAAGPILQELAEVGQQIEPLLITADGVLINGNRRLAAMRELLARDPVRYAGFSVISAAVLPADVTAAEIEASEAALQMAPETKLAYGWINRRLKLRRQRDHLRISDEDIARAYRLADAGRIATELGELALAEAYLERFARAPGHYSLVADAEPLFGGLYGRLQALAPPLAGLWELAGLAMIHGRAAVEGPMDRHFPFAAPAPGQMPALALRRFAEERGLIAAGGDPSQPLDAAACRALEAIFSDPGRSAALAAELYGLMERLRAEFQDLDSPVRAIHLLEKLRDTLFKLDPEKLTPVQRRQIRSEVAAIEAQTAVLLEEAGEPPADQRQGPMARLFWAKGR